MGRGQDQDGGEGGSHLVWWGGVGGFPCDM